MKYSIILMKSLAKPARLCIDSYRTPDVLKRIYKQYQPRVLTRKGPSATKLISIVHNNDLYLAFSGCHDIDDVMECVNTKVKKPLLQRPDILVSETTWNIYDELREDIEDVLKGYTDIRDIVFTGHSLGGALAVLTACLTSVKAKNLMYCVSYGAPQFASKEFQALIDEQLPGTGHKRVVIQNDIVPLIKFNPALTSNGDTILVQTNVYNFIEAHSCTNYFNCVRDKFM